mmetsp:Transcript_3685/g.11933  ORF Transcript_3685/g.11933 Transcript_3685/m.11933 type:complete len:256 (-) Transcript_3685:1162-1929(-)
MPTMAESTRLEKTSSSTPPVAAGSTFAEAPRLPFLRFDDLTGGAAASPASSVMSRWARASTRSPLPDMSLMRRKSVSRVSSVSATVPLALLFHEWVHSLRMFSPAPFAKKRRSPVGRSTMTPDRFSDESKGKLRTTVAPVRRVVYVSGANAARIAHSVAEPMKVGRGSPSSAGAPSSAVEFDAIAWARKLRAALGALEPSPWSLSPLPTCTDVTVIWFLVRVPVLSEQMSVAEPIVSHADKCRTRLLSCSMRRIE